MTYRPLMEAHHEGALNATLHSLAVVISPVQSLTNTALHHADKSSICGADIMRMRDAAERLESAAGALRAAISQHLPKLLQAAE